jgi:hypothetical protein
MTRGSGRGRGTRTVAVTWAAIAEICLVGAVILWLGTSAGAHAGYGKLGSVALAGLSILVTVVAVVGAFSSSGWRRGSRLAVAGVLAVTAGGVLPLAITGLVTAGAGVGLLLALAVVGMEILAVHLIRANGSNRGRRERA